MRKTKKTKITAIVLSLLTVLLLKFYYIPNASADIVQIEPATATVIQEEDYAMLDFSKENSGTLVLAAVGAGCLIGTAALVSRRSPKNP